MCHCSAQLQNLSVAFFKQTEFDLFELIYDIPHSSTNIDCPRDGDHPRVNDHPNDLLNPTNNNPKSPAHRANHPGHPDCLYCLLIKVSSTHTHIDIMTTSAQQAAVMKKKN